MNAPSEKSDSKNRCADDTGASGVRKIAVADNRVDSGDLFSSSREITIAHGSETYRLRLTSQNKLILTK